MTIALSLDDLDNDIFSLDYSNNLQLRIVRINESVAYNSSTATLDYFNIEVRDISDADNVVSYKCPSVIGFGNDYMKLLPLSNSALNGYRLTSNNYEDCYIELEVSE